MWRRRATVSHAAEPVVSAVFPEPTGKAVCHVHRRYPFRILEAELGRDAQLERISITRRQDLVGDLERQQRLRMQRGYHVDARVVSVRAFEAHIFGGEVGADALEEGAERHAGPFADHAPALDATRLLSSSTPIPILRSRSAA